MSLVHRRILPITVLLLVMIPLPVRAIPTITCHCFTDRSYDPSRPAAADPYFLATVQNSFMAVVFGVDKKSIVIAKQKGASADDLWIAYRVAAPTGSSPQPLLQARQKGTWREVLAVAKVPASSLGARFTGALAANASPAALAVVIVDELLVGYRLLGAAELAALRAAGATNQEVIIAALVAAPAGHPARQLLQEVKSGNRSWGALLREAKIEPADLQRYLASRLKGESR